MFKFTKYVFLSILLVALAASFAFTQYQKKVDGVQIKNIISTIASDEYMGRETGTKGCEMAEEYIANQFKELKLKPAGDKDSYFYTYTLSFYKIEGDLGLVVDNRTFYYGRNEDFTVERLSDGGKVSGEIVFAGYGINSSDKNRNDFENLDIKGKIVLIKRGCPNNEWDKWKEVATDSTKAEYCFKNGAVGMLLYEPTQPSSTQMFMPSPGPVFPNSLSTYNQVKNFPVFRVDERVTRYILENSLQSYQNISRNIDTKVMSCNTGRKASMSAKVTYERERKVRDVLAMIPGSDSKLKNEAIIIGGHLDHLGVDMDGKLYPGADDNASGSSTALGVAKAMIKNKFKPKRTVIFAAWTGEEKGLLGSRAWCEKPTWDLSKVVVYFNLDMVGLGDVKLNFPGIYYATDVWKFLKENSDTSYLNRVTPSKGGPGGSDHTPFLQKGVAAFAGMTAGQHPDYHQPGDKPEKISSDILQFVGDFMYHCIEILANSKENFIAPDRNIDNKFRLASIYNLYPLSYGEYKNILTDKDVDFSLVNCSGKLDASNQDKNFLTTLKLLDEAYKSNSTDKEYNFIQNPNEVRFSSYRGLIPLLTSIDLDLYGYNEVFCKALAKSGAKLGFIKSGAPFAKDKFDKNKTLGNIMDGGMAVILKDLPSDEIINIFNQVEKPVGILNSNLDILTDDNIQKMKSKGHIFFYEISLNTPTDEIIKNLETIKSKLGNDLVALYPSGFDDAMFKKMKELFLTMDKKDYDGNFTGKVFGENFSSFLVKALQERQQAAQRGRPF